MRITLTVVDGPHKGRLFDFADHDTFLVGRSKFAHFQLIGKDKFFSRLHFLMELNPPQCRIVDLNSRNGTFVNGQRVTASDLNAGDQIRAGHTILQLSIQDEGVRDTPVARTETAKVLPGFACLRELGRGVLGETHLVRRLADDHLLALKTIVPASAASPAQVRSFLQEIRALRQLEHPGLVNLFNVVEAEGRILVLSDYVVSADANQLIGTRGPLPIAEAVAILVQVLEALEYAHARNQVHGDLKPSNLLLRDEGGKCRACLTDFGLARIYQASRLSGLSMTRAVIGGAFLPPERITHYRDVNPASDQYGAAATLYFLLTGQHVQDMTGDLGHRLTRIFRSGLVPIDRHRPDLPPGLVQTIHRALARLPERRFPSVAAMRKALLQV